jgi:hypothetical protein
MAGVANWSFARQDTSYAAGEPADRKWCDTPRFGARFLGITGTGLALGLIW